MIQNLRIKKQIVTVFGNETEAEDNLAVKLVPLLDHRFPMIDFRIEDPTENIEPPSDPWVIMDVGVGIEKIIVIEDLKDLDYVKGSSVHDFDVYLDLRIREKLGKLPKIKVILIPNNWTEDRAAAEINRFISVRR